ncbi:hypothetical protein EJB05_25869, partial [Eragrostis curvula]
MHETARSPLRHAVSSHLPLASCVSEAYFGLCQDLFRVQTLPFCFLDANGLHTMLNAFHGYTICSFLPAFGQICSGHMIRENKGLARYGKEEKVHSQDDGVDLHSCNSTETAPVSADIIPSSVRIQD